MRGYAKREGKNVCQAIHTFPRIHPLKQAEHVVATEEEG